MFANDEFGKNIHDFKKMFANDEFGKNIHDFNKMFANDEFGKNIRDFNKKFTNIFLKSRIFVVREHFFPYPRTIFVLREHIFKFIVCEHFFKVTNIFPIFANIF
jgi:hypothetical protein